MGTRGTIHVLDGKKTILSVYRQMDSYPTGLGKEIFDLLKFSKITDGYTIGQQCPDVFNGIGCMAAYLIGHLKLVPYGRIKNAIGNVYVTDNKDRQEYNYFISAKGEKLNLRVTDSSDKELFSGEMIKFDAKKIEDSLN